MKNTLPKHCFIKQGKIWYTFKDAEGVWRNKPTPYRVGQEDLAGRYLRSLQRGMAEKGDRGPLTLRVYVERWLKEREEAGVASVQDDRRRLNKYVLPKYGDFALGEFRPMHARDLVRGLRALKKDDGTAKLAPRTVLHVFRTLHNVFESAIIDEFVIGNPVVVKKGELPKKVDKDSEWRVNATYTVREVERLISDPIIPVERRVQYALKAIAGMRHGEMAALCWRHLDYTAEPLTRINICQAWDSREKKVKGTKDEHTRSVPMHPTLAKIIAAWKLEHWERIYGRRPTDDDFVVPARTMRCVNAADAGHAMQDDFAALGIRHKAGKHRNRGGHDLRSWYRTRCIEDDADSTLIDRTSHSAPKTVKGGYDRFSWAAICREVAKLKVSILDGEVLTLLPTSFLVEKKSGNRWRKEVTPKGLEADSVIEKAPQRIESTVADAPLATIREHEVERPLPKRSARMLERALLSGDTARALRIVRELSGDMPSSGEEPSRTRARRLKAV
jgi:integrase